MEEYRTLIETFNSLEFKDYEKILGEPKVWHDFLKIDLKLEVIVPIRTKNAEKLVCEKTILNRVVMIKENRTYYVVGIYPYFEDLGRKFKNFMSLDVKERKKIIDFYANSDFLLNDNIKYFDENYDIVHKNIDMWGVSRETDMKY